MISASSTPPGRCMSIVVMVWPSRMMVVESAISRISLVLWEMMMQVIPAALSWRMRLEQVLGVVVVERRGRLVQDEQRGVLDQRLGDLDELLLAHADLQHPRVSEVLVQAHLGHDRLGAHLGLVPVDDSVPGALVTEKMFSAIERNGLSAVSWWMIAMPLASDSLIVGVTSCPLRNLTLVGAVGVDSGEDLHEGGLTCAVLAADGVDLTPSHREGDVIECHDAGESLGDRAHLKDGLVVRRRGSCLVPSQQGQDGSWPRRT